MERSVGMYCRDQGVHRTLKGLQCSFIKGHAFNVYTEALDPKHRASYAGDFVIIVKPQHVANPERGPSVCMQQAHGMLHLRKTPA